MGEVREGVESGYILKAGDPWLTECDMRRRKKNKADPGAFGLSNWMDKYHSFFL